ncbi:MAG: hypothetical protein WBA41_00885 [Rivularia sp. (in: cyanobacteria)]
MGRHLKITIASIASVLALAIAGCSGEEEPTTVAPIPTETAENNQGKTTEPFKDPVVPAKQSPTIARAPSTLIQPTNPTERVGIVSKGRADPFEGIIPPVKFSTKKAENPASNNGSNSVRNSVGNSRRAVPRLPPLPTSNRTTASRQRPRRSAVISATTGGNRRRNITGSRNSNSSRSGSTSTSRATSKTPNKANPNGGSTATTPVVPVVPKIMPGVIPQPDLASVLPPPPEPKLAQAVLVSGVVQVGNKPQAIIKVPSEPTSRYVQAGQRLASGLLVKRIEMNEGSEPIVILEQYGIEVARMVGESPMGATQPATASTDNPVSTLPSLPKSAFGAS